MWIEQRRSKIADCHFRSTFRPVCDHAAVVIDVIHIDAFHHDSAANGVPEIRNRGCFGNIF